MVHLGDIIRQLREEAGLGLRELARKARVDAGSLSKLENHDQHQLNDENLARVAQALGTTADHVRARAGTDMAEPPPRRWPTLEEWLARDRNLTDDQRKVILAVYRSYVPPRR